MMTVTMMMIVTMSIMGRMILIMMMIIIVSIIIIIITQTPRIVQFCVVPFYFIKYIFDCLCS